MTVQGEQDKQDNSKPEEETNMVAQIKGKNKGTRVVDGRNDVHIVQCATVAVNENVLNEFITMDDKNKLSDITFKRIKLP